MYGFEAISLNEANEMMAYEGSMNRLRCLAIYVTEHEEECGGVNEAIFAFIKEHSRAFGADIYKHGLVLPETVERLDEEAEAFIASLGMGQEEVTAASRRQLCARGGFSEMRRFLGQLPVAVDEVAKIRPDMIIGASLSGCVPAEHLAISLEARHGLVVPVEHVIFRRSNKQPSCGLLRPGFKLLGPKVVIVEDTVQESRTVRTCLAALMPYGEVTPSLYALEIDVTTAAQESLGLFDKVVTFEE